MKAIIFKNGNIEHKDIRDVAVKEINHVKIRIKATGLCGSDLNRILTDISLQTKILGHEFSGVVEEIGENVRNFEKGDKVTAIPLIPCGKCDLCNENKFHLCRNLKVIGKDILGAFAEEVIIPAKNLKRLQQNIDFDLGALADVVAVAVHSYNMSGSPKKKDIIILGDGALALSCLSIFEKDNEVTLVGKHKKNMDLALELGAINIIPFHAVNNLQHDLYDVAIECISRSQDKTISSAIRLVKPGGKIVVTGVFQKNYMGLINFRQLFYKEVALIGSNSYSFYKSHNKFNEAIELISTYPQKYRKLISHILPLSEFGKGIEMMQDKETSGAIKIIFHP